MASPITLDNSNPELNSDAPPETEVYLIPASEEQSRFWLLDRLGGASTASNMAIYFEIRGKLEDALVEETLGRLLTRHESLRTTYRIVDGSLEQVITAQPRFGFVVEDLQSISSSDREREAARLVSEHSHRRIDLESGPVFHALLIHVSDTRHFLAYTIHQIAVDGWSNGILLRDTAELYAALAERRPARLPELPFQFADFTVWQREYLASEAAGASLAFWKQQLGRDFPVIDLPTDFPRRAARYGEGHIESELLPGDLQARLARFCRENDATVHQVLLATFEAVLSRYAGQPRFLLGTTVANRTQAGMENLVGRFANPQILLADVSGDPAFAELLARVAESSSRGYAHQDYPFARLLAELESDASGLSSQFLLVNFLYQKAFMQPQAAGPVEFLPRPSVSGGVNFDLLVSVVEREEGPRLQMEYNTELFSRARIRALIDTYIRTLAAVLEDSSLPVSALPLSSAPVPAAPAAAVVPPRPAAAMSVPGQLRALADRLRNEAAVLSDSGSMSWRELGEAADRTAAALLARGVRPGERVAVRMEPIAGALAQALGVMAAGAVLLPVPAHVDIREWSLLVDELRPALSLAGPAFARQHPQLCSRDALLSDVRQPQQLPDIEPGQIACELISVDAQRKFLLHPLTHGDAVRRSLGAAELLDLRLGDRVLVRAACSSAGAWVDTSLLLLSGATWVECAAWTPEEVDRRLLEPRALHALASTAEWRELFSAGRVPDRRLHRIHRDHRVAAGVRRDALQPPVRASLLLVSAEGGGISAVSPRRTGESTDWPLQAIPSESLLILDTGVQIAAPVVTGELSVGSEGAVHATGILAACGFSGSIEARGLKRDMVELKNFRLQIGELEDHLLSMPEITDAQVSILGDKSSSPALTAYVVSRIQQKPTVENVRSYLKSVAPAHLSSPEIVLVEDLPLRVDGFLDELRLPRPAARVKDLAPAVAPRDELETRLLAIWEETFNLRGIGIHSNFFLLGGYSMMIVRLFARMNKALGMQLPITTIFNAPTIAQLAEIIRGHSSYTSLVPVQPSGSKTPFFLIHSYLLYEGLRLALGEDQPFYGLREIDSEADMSVEQRAAHYVREIRSVQPHGPYQVGGWCAAGPLAVETARQLALGGEEVREVVLFDSWRPGYSAEVSRQERAPFTARLQQLHHEQSARMSAMPAPAKARYVWTKLRRRSMQIFHRLCSRNRALAEQVFGRLGLALPDFMHNVSLKTLHALRRHQGEPFPGRILLIRATDAPQPAGGDPACGWNTVALEGTDVVWAPGDHESMFREPNLSVVGGLLRRHLA
jgi:non-ribosomal peptide synthetase component F/thioesterase domain-containing protein